MWGDSDHEASRPYGGVADFPWQNHHTHHALTPSSALSRHFPPTFRLYSSATKTFSQLPGLFPGNSRPSNINMAISAHTRFTIIKYVF